MSVVRRSVSALVVAALALGGVLVVAAPAQAAEFVVDTTSSNDADGNTLFEAIAATDPVFGPGADTITFAPGLTGTIEFTYSPLIRESLQIIGPGSGALTFTAASNLTFFTFAPLSDDQGFAISGVTFAGDDSHYGSAIAVNDTQGHVAQYVTIQDVTFADLKAFNYAAVDIDGLTGALFIADTLFQSNGNDGPLNGTALNVTDVPEVTMERTTFTGNTSPNEAGGFRITDVDELRIRDGGGSGNTAANGPGGFGFVDNVGFVLLSRVQVSENEALSGSGGGLYLGAIDELEIGDSQFTDNDASVGGALFFADGSSTIIIEDSGFSGSDAADDGGAIQFGDHDGEVRITGSTFTGNSTQSFGGAVASGELTGGPVTIRTSTFSGNFAGGGGAGLYLDTIEAEVEIDSSTFAGNDAANSAGVLFGLVGDEVDVVNSTFDERATTGTGAIGVGLAAAGGIVALRHVTVVGPGGITVGGFAGGFVSVSYAIVQSISAEPTLSTAPGAIGVSWSVLSDDPGAAITAGDGVQLSTAAQLGDLQLNGGTTMTRLPAATSPAVNAGDPAFAAPPALDQRGLARVVGGRIDVGAVERAAELAPTGSEPSWVAGLLALLALLVGAGLMRGARGRPGAAHALR